LPRILNKNTIKKSRNSQGIFLQDFSKHPVIVCSKLRVLQNVYVRETRSIETKTNDIMFSFSINSMVLSSGGVSFLRRSKRIGMMRSLNPTRKRESFQSFVYSKLKGKLM